MNASMPGGGPQRLATVGGRRAVAYAALVGGAAYLLAFVYGPDEPAARLAVTAIIAVGYVGVAHAVGTLRRRRVAR